MKVNLTFWGTLEMLLQGMLREGFCVFTEATRGVNLSKPSKRLYFFSC